MGQPEQGWERMANPPHPGIVIQFSWETVLRGNVYPASPLYCQSLFPWPLGGSRWQVSILHCSPKPRVGPCPSPHSPTVGCGQELDFAGPFCP